MIAAKRWAAAVVVCLVCASVEAGCTVAAALRGTPGTDVSGIKPGATKAQVEDVLGSPVREWVTSSGVRYRLYEYDGGVPPSKGTAAFHAAMDVFLVGIWEPVVAASNSAHGAPAMGGMPEPHVLGHMAVSYSGDDIVIAVFDKVGEFDDLPSDGRSP
ncbi:MAG: hypothetical protein U0587_11520 [Candidatus Binatia bacterium]